MEHKSRLPDFLIAGAMRSGTTSLYRYLGAHPQVAMAPKEIGFFTDHFDRGLDWYSRQFGDATPSQLLGDATADYLARHSAMTRIADTLPHVKLVISMRNPVDRAWSHYLLLKTRGRERRPYSVANDDELDLIARDGDRAHGAFYLYHGLYDSQLRRAVELLGRDQIHVSIFERMVTDPAATYRSLCAFLGIDAGNLPPNLGKKVNPYVTFRSLPLRRLSQRLPGPLGRGLARINTKRPDSPPRLDESQRERLDEFFAPRIADLSELLDDDLSEWRRR